MCKGQPKGKGSGDSESKERTLSSRQQSRGLLYILSPHALGVLRHPLSSFLHFSSAPLHFSSTPQWPPMHSLAHLSPCDLSFLKHRYRFPFLFSSNHNHYYALCSASWFVHYFAAPFHSSRPSSRCVYYMFHFLFLGHDLDVFPPWCIFFFHFYYFYSTFPFPV